MFKSTLFFKIIMVFTLPALGILYFSSILVYEKFNLLDEVYKTEHNLQYMKVTEKLIHSLQKERGLSTLNNLSKDFQDKLENQKKITDLNQQEYLKVLNISSLHNTHKNILKQFLNEFNSLKILRLDVKKSGINSLDVLHRYTKINELLLDSMSLIRPVKSAIDFNIEYSSIFNFLVYKEYLGIERALISISLLSELNDEIKKELLKSQLVQTNSLDYFKTNSSDAMIELYNNKISKEYINQIENIKFNLEEYVTFNKISVEEWWTLSSNNIDNLDFIFKEIIGNLNKISQDIQKNAFFEQNSSLLFLFVCFITLISLLFVLRMIIYKEEKAYKKIKKQKKVYELLNKTNKHLLKNETKEELYSQINRIISKNSTTVFSFIYDCHEQKLNNRIFAQNGVYKNILLKELDDSTDLTKENLLTKVLEKEKNIIIETFGNNTISIFHSYAKEFNIKSVAAFPIKKFEKIDSILVIYSNKDKFFDYEVEILFNKMISDFTHILEKFDYEKIRQEQEKELKISSVAFESSEPMIITDNKANIVNVNHAFCEVLGYTKEELINQNPKIFKSSHQDEEFYKSLWKDLIKNDSWSGEVYNTRKNNEILPLRVSITTIRDKNNNITNYLGQYIDIREQKDQEKILQYQATHDNLTTLPNRLLLLDRIERAITKVIRHNIVGGLIFIDLDNFKDINDSLGHSVGDSLLIAIAKKLKEVVRDEDTISRIGGDEFIILADNIGNNNHEARQNIEVLAKKVKDALNSIEFIDGFKNISTPSIGVTLFSDDSVSVNDIIKQADTAMYAAKKQGKNTIEFFN